jgi:NAD(P)-dependent dehydrogenase (short-subunit alcohol dehydrogenase family)
LNRRLGDRAWIQPNCAANHEANAFPLGRTGTPDEMANMIVFFCSDAASYITGETISVSGGPNIGGIEL